ncbi:MAG: flippase-like domain-containing protein [Patescibacteria group bacterium]
MNMIETITKNKSLRVAITTIVIVTMVFFLWQFSGQNNLLETLKNISPTFVILAFFLYFLTSLAKAMRFRFSLKNKIGLGKMLNVVFIHSFWNNFLPLRLGEISYLYMINEAKEVSGGENVNSLFLARIFDILIISIIFFISGFLIFRENSNVLESIPLALIVSILISSLVILLVAVFYRQKLSQFFSDLSFKNQLLNKFFKFISQTFLVFDQISNIKKLTIFTASSFVIWILDALSIWAVLFSVGFKFSFVESSFLVVFPAIVGVLPINFVGNFGSFEGVVTGGLVFLSVSVEKALSLSVLLHIQILLFSFILFVFAFLNRNFSNKTLFNSQAKTHTEFYFNLGNPEKDFRNNNLNNLVFGFLKKGNLLDIGAGLGALLHRASKGNRKVKGLEPDEGLVNLSVKLFGELNIIQTSLENYESREKFDNIVAVDVLECIADYKEALKKITSFLNNNGRLILVVPAHPSLFGSRDKLMRYFRRFDKKEFSLELKNLGLKIIKVRHWNFLMVLPYWILYKVFKKESLFDGIRDGKNGKNLLSNFLNFWFKYIENKINPGFGLSLIFVTEKDTI